MVKIVNELIDRLEREEITNLQCIAMHGREWVDLHKEWCQVIGVEEDDEAEAEMFINEIRFGDEPDNADEWPETVWDTLNKEERKSKEEDVPSKEILEQWRNDKALLTSLKNSSEAVKITLWRYLHSEGGFKTCARTLSVSKNTVKKWWNIPLFLDAVIADGGHVHPIRLEYDIIKGLILEAVEKVEKKSDDDVPR